MKIKTYDHIINAMNCGIGMVLFTFVYRHYKVEVIWYSIIMAGLLLGISFAIYHHIKSRNFVDIATKTMCFNNNVIDLSKLIGYKTKGFSTVLNFAVGEHKISFGMITRDELKRVYCVLDKIIASNKAVQAEPVT